MNLSQIALVDETKSLTVDILTQTAAALQKQATRDLGPIWNIQATVDYFPDISNVPPGYWPIIIMSDIPSAAEGFHQTKDGQPLSLILNDDAWQLTCSHEMCEMLVDPFGNQTRASDSIVAGEGRVNYILEVCDPCGGPNFTYSVNGVTMCDFYTPQYFDPVQSAGVRYSFTGAITQPKQILPGGYLCWVNPETNKTFMANMFGPQLQIAEVANFITTQGSLRERVDSLIKSDSKKRLLKDYSEKNKSRLAKTIKSSNYVGENIRREIDKYRLRKLNNH